MMVFAAAVKNRMLGRVGDLPHEMQPREFALFVKECLRAGGVRFCDCGKPIRRVAVGGGACGKLMDSALAKGADAFVIGDCSYDLMQRAQSLGLTGRCRSFPDRKSHCSCVRGPDRRGVSSSDFRCFRASC